MSRAESVTRRDCEATTNRIEKRLDSMDGKLDSLDKNFIILQTRFDDLKIHFNDNLKGTVALQSKKENRSWDMKKSMFILGASVTITVILFIVDKLIL